MLRRNRRFIRATDESYEEAPNIAYSAPADDTGGQRDDAPAQQHQQQHHEEDVEVDVQQVPARVSSRGRHIKLPARFQDYQMG